MGVTLVIWGVLFLWLWALDARIRSLHQRLSEGKNLQGNDE